MQFRAYMPVEVLFGPGKVSSLGEVSSRLGKRAFLVTMKELVDLEIADHAIESLRKANIDFALFDKVKGEPKSGDIDSATEVLRESGCDFVIGLGGGSCIDTAKALAICARHPEPVWEYVNLSNRPPQPVVEKDVLPIIAIPTTAGTGSEVTPYAVITNTETVQKGTIKESAIFARVAIVDPELTISLPPKLTAATGVDAFAHALESYLNVKNRTPYSDIIVEEALCQITKWLLLAYRDGKNLDARTGMAWGSTLGGIAISQAGTTVVHAIAQPLGARMGLSHSESVAVFLPAVMRHTLPAEQERFARLGEIFSCGTVDKFDINRTASAAIDSLEQFLDNLGMHLKISDFGNPEGIDNDLAEDVTSYMSRPLGQHPKVFGKEDIRRIVRDSL